MTQVVFRTTRFFRWWIFGATILFAAGWLHFWRSQGMVPWTWCFTLLALLALLGLIDSLRRRIALMPDGIEIRSGFRRRFLPRVEILAVTWEGGSGVALKLVDGRCSSSRKPVTTARPLPTTSEPGSRPGKQDARAKQGDAGR